MKNVIMKRWKKEEVGSCEERRSWRWAGNGTLPGCLCLQKKKKKKTIGENNEMAKSMLKMKKQQSEEVRPAKENRNRA